MAAHRPTFRPLEDGDLPLLHRWLNEPGIVRWWEGDDVSWDGVVRDYGSGREPDGTEHHLALLDGEPIGWIQCYPCAVSPEECEPWFALGVDRACAGIDYLLGEPERRGAGLGSSMIRAYATDVVFAEHPTWTQAAAAPVSENQASCGALRKAGFRFVGELDTDVGPSSLHVLDRP